MEIGYYRIISQWPRLAIQNFNGAQQKGHMQLKKNNFVVTLKTEKEITDYFGSHIPEEQRLLWLGFFIAHNHIAHKLEEIDAKKN